jgi:hypothetical protein
VYLPSADIDQRAFHPQAPQLRPQPEILNDRYPEHGKGNHSRRDESRSHQPDKAGGVGFDACPFHIYGYFFRDSRPVSGAEDSLERGQVSRGGRLPARISTIRLDSAARPASYAFSVYFS